MVAKREETIHQNQVLTELEYSHQSGYLQDEKAPKHLAIWVPPG